MAEYGAYLPAGLDGGKDGAKERGNAGRESRKPVFRVVSA